MFGTSDCEGMFSLLVKVDQLGHRMGRLLVLVGRERWGDCEGRFSLLVKVNQLVVGE